MDPLAYANTYLDDEHFMYSVDKLYKIQTLPNMFRRREKNNINMDLLNMLSYQNWNFQNMSPAGWSQNHQVWEKKILVSSGQRFIKGASFYFQILGGEKKTTFLY